MFGKSRESFTVHTIAYKDSTHISDGGEINLKYRSFSYIN